MVEAERTSTVVGGLKPNTEYSFRLKAYNMRGDGAFSAPIKMITRGLRKFILGGSLTVRNASQSLPELASTFCHLEVLSN